MIEAQKSRKLWNMQHLNKSTKSDKHGHEAIGRVKQNDIKHALKQWRGNPDKHCFIIYLCYLLSYWTNPKSCFSVSDKMISSSHTNVLPVFSYEKTKTKNLLTELTKTKIFWMMKFDDFFISTERKVLGVSGLQIFAIVFVYPNYCVTRQS